MKKLFFVALFVVTLLFSSAYADSFSLHGDVCFDMTVEEMIEAETKNGFSPEELKLNYADIFIPVGQPFNFEKNYSAVYRVDGSFVMDLMKTIYYFFDKDGKLCQMLYTQNPKNSYTALAPYKKIIPGLSDLFVNKYGNPLDQTVSILNVIDLHDFPTIYAESDLGALKFSLGNIGKQWVYQYNDNMACNIEIDAGTLKYSTGLTACSMFICYTRISVDDYNASIENLTNEHVQTLTTFFNEI